MGGSISERDKVRSLIFDYIGVRIVSFNYAQREQRYSEVKQKGTRRIVKSIRLVPCKGPTWRWCVQLRVAIKETLSDKVDK